MYIAENNRHEIAFACFETRREAVAWALRDEDAETPNFWTRDGETVEGRGRADYSIAVHDGVAAAVASMDGGDEHSLPGALRALADALEDWRDEAAS